MVIVMFCIWLTLLLTIQHNKHSSLNKWASIFPQYLLVMPCEKMSSNKSWNKMETLCELPKSPFIYYNLNNWFHTVLHMDNLWLGFKLKLLSGHVKLYYWIQNCESRVDGIVVIKGLCCWANRLKVEEPLNYISCTFIL
jgi:hypothetical protein